MCDGRGLCRCELGRVKSETEGSLDAWSEGLGVAEAQETEVVDLCLDEGGVVKVSLGTDLEVDLAVGNVLGVVSCSGTDIDVSVDSVVVGCSVGGEVAKTVESDGVLWGVETSGEVVLGDLCGLDIVGCLGTSEETITANDGVGSEDWSLEEVNELASVESWLLVLSREDGVLGLLLWDERRGEVELETLCGWDVVLDLVSEDVGSGPCLSEGKTLLPVLVLGLEVTGDVAGLGVTVTNDLEGDAVWSLGLDFETGAVDWAVG